VWSCVCSQSEVGVGVGVEVDELAVRRGADKFGKVGGL